MVLLLIGLLAIFLLGCSPQVELRGRSAPGAIYLRPFQERPPQPALQPLSQPSILPAHLVLAEKSFEEPSGNNALDAEEEGALVLQVSNDGLGPGRVSVRLTPLSDVEHLHFVRVGDGGVLAVQESKTLRVPIQAGTEVEDGQREVRVEVVEENNRATIPFTFSFTTRRLVTPQFRVIVRDYEDGRFFAGNNPDGLIQAGEMVRVKANVQNLGGEAEDVQVAVETGQGVTYTRDLKGIPDNHFALGSMASGSNQDIEFYFFTSPIFAVPKVSILIRVGEARGRFGKVDTLALEIGQSVKKEDVFAVQAGGEKKQPFVLVGSELVDIEQLPQGTKSRQEKALAVIVGIEKYRHTFAASFKNRDAVTVYRYFRDVLRIPEERIQLQTDEDAGKADLAYLFEPKGTTNEGWLEKRLRDPGEAAQTDLYVYLAGHGFPDLATGQPYLIPYDVRPEQAANGVSLNQLYQTLSGFGTHSVTVFVESCFSGSSGYDRGGSEKLLALNMNPVFPVIEQPLIGQNMVVFSATSGKKPSSNRDDLKHGIFTYFLLKGLGGVADVDGDKAVTVEELFRYVYQEVPHKALEPPLDREQVPEVRPSVERLGERGKRVLVQY